MPVCEKQKATESVASSYYYKMGTIEFGPYRKLGKREDNEDHQTKWR